MPHTVNRYLNVPNTGDLPGAWGTSAINPNMSSIDGSFGGFTTISLSSATTFALTLPAGASFTPGAGPSQSENSLIKFAGTLTGNAVVQFAMPGYYIVHNTCGSATSFYIQLSPSSGPGNIIAAPPGRKCHVYFDGTDMDYVNTPEVGSALDLHQSGTSLPVWMTACSIRPYLIKDGSVFNASSYTSLSQYLGSTFGGNGVTTFGLPDERARARIAVDLQSLNTGTYAGRLTVAGSGVNGTTMAAAGGSEFVQAHTHTSTLTDPGHTHTLNFNPFSLQNFGANPANLVNGGGTYPGVNSATTSITLNNVSYGSGSSQNVMPSIISFLPLIKT